MPNAKLPPSVKALIARALPGRALEGRVAALEELLALEEVPRDALVVAEAAANGDTQPGGANGLPSQHAVMRDNDAHGAARWNLRWRGIAVLGRLRGCAENAAAALLSVEGCEDAVLRALGVLGHADDAVLARLREGLRKDNVDLRGTAAYSLVSLGISPADLVAPLRVGLDSTDMLTRQTTVAQLSRLKCHDACAALVSAASDRKWQLRADAFAAMRENGCGCELVLGALTRGATDRAELARREAQRSAAALGVPSPTA